MAKPTVQILGLKELRRSLKQAGVGMADLKQANQQAAALVASNQAAVAPKKTGRLKGSVRPSKTVARAQVTSRLPYSGPIHWGWPSRNIGPRPWLAATAQATEPIWLEIYLADVQKLLDQVHGV